MVSPLPINGSDLKALEALKNKIGGMSLKYVNLEQFSFFFAKLDTGIGKQDLSVLFGSFDQKKEGMIDFEEFIWKLLDSERQLLEDALLSHFRSLSRPLQEKGIVMIEKLHHMQNAQAFYDSITKEERKLVLDILAACKQLDFDDPDHLDFGGFEELHTAMGQVLGTGGYASWELAGQVFTEDAHDAFEAMDLDLMKTVCAAEIADWCRGISEKLPASEDPKSPGKFHDFLKKILTRCQANNEVEKYTKAYELQQSLGQYGEAFRKLKSDQTVEVRSKNAPIEELMQPAAEGGRKTTFDDLVEQGKQILSKVEAIGMELRQHVAASFWSMGPLKARARSEEKIEKDYEGEGRRLLDVVRMSIVCDDLSMVKKAIDFMDARADLDVVRVKSGFDPSCKFAISSGGYRDCKLNVRHLFNGHMFEVQLHILSFYSLKREGGHHLYKWCRQFSVAGILSANDVLTKVNKNLLKEMVVSTQERLKTTLEQRGADDHHAMEYRITLAQLAKMANNHKILGEQLETLLEDVAKHRVCGMDVHDEAEIFLLCAGSEYYEADKSLELAKKGKDSIASLGTEDELCEGEVLFLARCHAALGSILWRMDKLEDAAGNYKKAIEQFEKAVDSEHPTLQGFVRSLGGILIKQDKVDEGLEYLHRLEPLITHAVQKSRLQMELGNAYEAKKDYKKASEYFQLTLAKKRADFGDKHVAVANASLPLGKCKKEMGDNKEALDLLMKASAIYEESLKEAKGTSADFYNKQNAEAKKIIDEIEGTVLCMRPDSRVGS